MSTVETQLGHALIEEMFGSIVVKVLHCVCKNGSIPLKLIAIKTNLKLNQVRKSLCVLLQHKFVSYQLYKKQVIYKANVKSILNLLYYPKMIYTSKVLYGDAAELIVEEILHHGIALMSETIDIVVKRLHKFDKEGSFKEKVESAFNDLVSTHFLQREPEVQAESETDDPSRVPQLHIEENCLYKIPVLGQATGRKRKISDDSANSAPQAKRSKLTNALPEDDGVYWSVNIARFLQFFRDQAIVAAMTRKCGSEYGEVIRAILRISEVTTGADAVRTQAVSAAEVSRSMSSSFALSSERINQHLRLLSNSTCKIVELVEDSGAGGSYVLNIKNSATTLATSSIVTYVEERFGSKSSRIFRLLLLKKLLEQKQVEEFAMIPSKEAKEYLYNMLSDNLLTLQELPRTADHAPSRTFYLYGVNIPKISRTLLLKCYKSIFNLMIRRKTTKKSFKRLLDKRRQIDAMKQSLKEEDKDQLQDIEEMLTSNERVQLEKYEHCSNKLLSGQLQIVDTVFILDIYLKSLLNNSQT